MRPALLIGGATAGCVQGGDECSFTETFDQQVQGTRLLAQHTGGAACVAGLCRAARPGASAGAHGLQFWAAEKLTHVGTFMNLPHYLPWVDYRACGYYFDTLGNVLAVLSGIADEPFAAEILAYGEMVGIELPFPCRAVDPVAYPGGPDWMDMYHNFGLGRPHQYVNGGGWPFIGGLWVIALQWLGRLQAAQRVLRGLEQAVCVPRGEDAAPDFAEWLHAVSGRPGGRTRQAWSAGGYLGACAALNEGNDPWQDYIVG